MTIEVLNQNFEMIYIVDTYESFIWTDRFNSPGDFEMYSPATESILKYFQRDNYVQMGSSDRMMIIEDIVYQSSSEGNHVKITGRSLESILDRRIVWGTYDVDGNLQDEIERLFNDSIINPEDPDRRISNFVFQRTSDPSITNLTITNQYTGNTLLEILENLSEEYDIGWKIRFDDGKFVFSFYQGTDRSFDQNVVPYVVFSPAYDNVIESTFTVAGSGLKTIVLVEGRESSGLSAEVSGENATLSSNEEVSIYRVIGSGTGLLRREMYINQTGIRKEDEMTEEEFISKLDQSGAEELQKFTVTKKFDGQYETKLIFLYGRDFFIGDIVEVEDEFGNHSSSKVIEFIWSNNTINGEEAYPTFRSTESNE